jgi:hypothetical protein
MHGQRFTAMRTLAATAALMLAAAHAPADHALRQDGLILFNVAVITDNTTQARPLRVFYKSDSFSYDYARDHHALLTGSQGYHDLADIVVTAVLVPGKRAARAFAELHGWNKYVPTPAPRLVAPTPMPTPVPTPTPEPEPSANEVAPAFLPIRERVERQAGIFVKEQEDIVHQARFGGKNGQGLEPEEGRRLRLRLLAAQLRRMRDYYPQDDAFVTKTVSALDDQTSKVETTGRFGWEY